MINGIKYKGKVVSVIANAVVPIDSGMIELMLSEKDRDCIETLNVKLQNKISFAKPAYERAGYFIGRCINSLKGIDDPEYIEINGLDLISVLSVTGESANLNLHAKHEYFLPFDQAVYLSNKINDVLEQK